MNGSEGAAPATGPTRRRRLIESAPGAHTSAFGATEWALVTAIALIWGASFFLIEIGLAAFTPGVVALLRVGLGALTLLCVPAARRPVERDDLARIGVLGIIWMGIPLILFPVAQQWIDSAVAGMINGAVPLTAAAWSVLLLRRAPGRAQQLGIAIGFVGVVAISIPELRTSSASALGMALVILAVAMYGLATNIAVPLQQRYGALPVLLRAQIAALLVVVPYGVWDAPGSRFAWVPLLAMLPLGILGTALAYVFMTTLVGRVGAARGTIAIYFVPLVAIVLGVAFLGERVSGFAVAGTALVLIGAWLTSRREN